MTKLTQSSDWKHLTKLSASVRSQSLAHLIQQFSDHRYAIDVAGLKIDYAYNYLNQEVISSLIQLAENHGLSEAIQALFSGQVVNGSEGRAAMHMALRNLSDLPMRINNHDLMPEVKQGWQRVWAWATSIQQQRLLGATGQAITDVVNIGVGGSDLGPRFLYHALTPYSCGKVRCHYIANIDPEALHHTLARLDPNKTVFLLTSKSFTTREMLLNADRAQQWLAQHLQGKSWQQQIYAITANSELAHENGILPENIFLLWDWLGGRYSVWSPVSLSVAASIGVDHFYEFLAGAHAVDQHFKSAPLASNAPVLLALLSIWYINFFHWQSRAIIPYRYYLQGLPEYLQQLHMESLGKSVTQNGESIDYATGATIWGGVGPNSQHGFHQLLFQGQQITPCDFIVEQDDGYSELLINCLTQREVLAKGYPYQQALADLVAGGLTQEQAQRLAPHKVIAGGNPSNLITLPKLSPYYLGALLALYEHKVYAQSVIWSINAFDQWGVERGKVLAKKILTNNKSLSPTDLMAAITNKL